MVTVFKKIHVAMWSLDYYKDRHADTKSRNQVILLCQITYIVFREHKCNVLHVFRVVVLIVKCDWQQKIVTTRQTGGHKEKVINICHFVKCRWRKYVLQNVQGKVWI